MIISVIVGIAIVVAASTALLSGRQSRKKDFSTDGFGITLTEAFTEENVDGYLAAYSSKNIAVFVSKEDISSLEELRDCTAEDYAELTKESNNLDDAEVKLGRRSDVYRIQIHPMPTQTKRTVISPTYTKPTTHSGWCSLRYPTKTRSRAARRSPNGRNP